MRPCRHGDRHTAIESLDMTGLFLYMSYTAQPAHGAPARHLATLGKIPRRNELIWEVAMGSKQSSLAGASAAARPMSAGANAPLGHPPPTGALALGHPGGTKPPAASPTLRRLGGTKPPTGAPSPAPSWRNKATEPFRHRARVFGRTKHRKKSEPAQGVAAHGPAGSASPSPRSLQTEGESTGRPTATTFALLAEVLFNSARSFAKNAGRATQWTPRKRTTRLHKTYGCGGRINSPCPSDVPIIVGDTHLSTPRCAAQEARRVNSNGGRCGGP